MIDPLRRNAGFALGTLLATSATLVCCVLPAVLVSMGAGAVLIGLTTSFPQLVWLSEHKTGVFVSAAALLAASGILIWRARELPCPVDADAARACSQLRKLTAGLYAVSMVTFAVGFVFAFVL